MNLTYFVLNLLLQNELKPIKRRSLDQAKELFRLRLNLRSIEMRINADRLKLLIDKVTMDSLKF